ncbi:cardiolipin synthase [Halalkalibacillus sediminis]|uniref:Cardiolipin synthase n=1 Tax=Halalkalibacillus sediminis TaxID=2018042 RepID=A0A2I0QTQ2_9BACI|nr:phospholipase D-like domain-containing protein [Halalkalibacillus sediminis]PKR77706.1 cardiolipin synthase [Halalkalibacillus sediminis]
MWVFVIIILIIIFVLLKDRTIHQSIISSYPTRKADIQFFNNGKFLFKQLFRDIRDAEQFICVQFFIIKKDRFSRDFLTLLIEKADAGVPVYLMVDRLGSFTIDRKLIQELKSVGGTIIKCNRFDWRHPFRSINQRNHRKITVVDGEIAYIGGYNVADEYINESPKFSLWRDYHLRVTGEVVQDIYDLFSRDFKLNNGHSLHHGASTEPGGSIETQLIPSAHGTLESTFLSLIDEAKQTILIGSPYFIPSEAIMELLEKKAQDGVSITVLYPHESDHLLVKEASSTYLRRMHHAGAKIHLFTHGFYHAKIIFIDDKICDIGTANFDKRSLFINEEVNLLIFDKGLIEEIRSFYEKDLMDSVPLDEKWLNEGNFLAKSAAKMFNSFL